MGHGAKPAALPKGSGAPSNSASRCRKDACSTPASEGTLALPLSTHTSADTNILSRRGGSFRGCCPTVSCPPSSSCPCGPLRHLSTPCPIQLSPQPGLCHQRPSHAAPGTLDPLTHRCLSWNPLLGSPTGTSFPISTRPGSQPPPQPLGGCGQVSRAGRLFLETGPTFLPEPL